MTAPSQSAATLAGSGFYPDSNKPAATSFTLAVFEARKNLQAKIVLSLRFLAQTEQMLRHNMWRGRRTYISYRTYCVYFGKIVYSGFIFANYIPSLNFKMTVISKIPLHIYQTTWNDIPEDNNFNTHDLENLISYEFCF
jgi:hypothetical protein